VTRLTRYSRGLLVASAALALSAGAVFAAGHAPASSGHPAPVAKSDAETPDVEENETPEVDEVDEGETPEVEAPDTESPDSEAADSNTNVDRPQNHGWFVSQAAQLPTPAEFANHGAYVSSIAHGTLGKPAAAANAAKTKAAKTHAGGN
jgi:hypothetical protein